MEVVGEGDQRGVIGLPLAALVAADRILAQAQVHRQLELGDPPALSNLLQSKMHIFFKNIASPP